MEMFLDVFRNRPGKSISSFIVVMFSLVTLLMFQKLKIETISEFFNYLSSSKDNSTLLLTWGLNLFTFMFLVIMGILWIKDVVRDNFQDISPELGRIISLLVGILHLFYSFLFVSYIFSKLLGIVLVALIVLVILYGDSSKNR